MRARAWPAAALLLAAIPSCTNDYENFRFPRQPSTGGPTPDGGNAQPGADAPSAPPPATGKPDARPPDSAGPATMEGGTAVPEGSTPPLPDASSEAGPSDAAFDVTNG